MWSSIAILVSITISAITLCDGQQQESVPTVTAMDIRNRISVAIGNLTVEMLYHAAKAIPEVENVNIAPQALWNLLAALVNGAAGKTKDQIRFAARLSKSKTEEPQISQLNKLLQTTEDLIRISAILLNKGVLLERDFRDDALSIYDTTVEELDLKDKDNTAAAINEKVSNKTGGKIRKLVDPSYFEDPSAVLVSETYFQGHWTSPFDPRETSVMSFFDSNGLDIGDVPMMYNRFKYPFVADLKELQARVIELPYGKEKGLSMLVMLPNSKVTMENLFFNVANTGLDIIFRELEKSLEVNEGWEVDCLLPKFRIETEILMNSMLKKMGIYDMFDKATSHLVLARTTLYVSRFMHKAAIEVAETQAKVDSVTSGNRVGVIKFQANRPFMYMVVEKSTHTVVLAGIYRSVV